MKAEEARSPALRIACRAIAAADETAIVALLCAGFANRPRAYWDAAMARLRDRRLPEGYPRYGYCLTVDDVIVGVILLIHSAPERDGDPIRCCVSSWYVEPRYRLYASALVKVAFRRKDCTYINMSSESHTREALSAQGYSCYAAGQVLAVPAFGKRRPATVVRRVTTRPESTDSGTGQLLLDHADAPCIALTATDGDRIHPFVFLKRSIPRTPLSCAQLIYCETVDAFVRMQGPVGRYLLRQGLPIVMLDANGPIEGLVGRYFNGRMPKYYIGAAPPRLGDLSYSEAALFGP